MLQAVASFALVAGLMTLTPGIDTALVLRTAARYRRADAFAVAAGIAVGCLAWGTSAAIGISALLTTSETAFTVLKLVGAAYMTFLGGRMLLQAVRGTDAHPEPADGSPTAAPGGALRFFRTGLATNLLNPKVGAFYVALLPQFIPPGQSAALAGALLALVHALESMAWFTVLIMLVHRLGVWLRRPATRRGIDAAAGATVVGFGVKLALTPS